MVSRGLREARITAITVLEGWSKSLLKNAMHENPSKPSVSTTKTYGNEGFERGSPIMRREVVGPWDVEISDSVLFVVPKLQLCHRFIRPCNIYIQRNYIFLSN